jgi:thiol-disulfide isomerase/thioredoxin
MKKISLSILICLIGLVAMAQDIPSWKITDIEKQVSTKSGDILVINFWATFCKPCVAEIPSFIKITDQYKDKGVKLQLVSLDLPSYYPAKIKSFAAKRRFNTNIAWLDETNADYFCPKIDPSWSGSIPATLIVNTKTQQRFFYEGEMSAVDFEKALKGVL